MKKNIRLYYFKGFIDLVGPGKLGIKNSDLFF